MYKLKKILVAVDYSALSKTALKHAVGLAAHGAELEVIYAWAAPYGHADLEPIVEKTEKKSLTALMLEKATAEMESFLSDVTELPSVKHHAHVLSGEPAETIVRTARDGKFDLIVMGTHGRSGLPRVLLGSVAERVVQHAPCPVLTVPGPK
jgi:nucleotide-binding universal stress UspA family protein